MRLLHVVCLTEFVAWPYFICMSHTQIANEGKAPTAALSFVNIDCANPARQAHFYAAALGWEVSYSDDNYAMVEGDGVRIGFGKIEGFRPTRGLTRWLPNASTSIYRSTMSTRQYRTCARSERVNLTSNPVPTAGRSCSIPMANRFA